MGIELELKFLMGTGIGIEIKKIGIDPSPGWSLDIRIPVGVLYMLLHTPPNPTCSR